MCFYDFGLECGNKTDAADKIFFVSQYVETTLVSLSSTQLKLSRKELVPFSSLSSSLLSWIAASIYNLIKNVMQDKKTYIILEFLPLNFLDCHQPDMYFI